MGGDRKIAEGPHAEPCGAKTRAGHSCGRYAMPNGRCRMHGGLSTGARTPEGLERCRRSNWKHGRYSAEARAKYKELMQLIKETKKLIDAF